jgi:hypothetical protein
MALISALDGGGWSTPRPGRFTSGTETRCSLYRRLGGPWDRSGLVRKISPSPGFDPQTAQPVAIPSTLTRLNKGDSWQTSFVSLLAHFMLLKGTKHICK